MGDEADWIIDNYMYEDDDPEWQDEELGSYTPNKPCCKYCGKTGFKWVNKDNKWRLYDGDKPHFCEKYKKV